VEHVNPVDAAGAFLGVPYRPDGALDASGRWTLFADPTARLAAPGLNCSGFVLAAVRAVLQAWPGSSQPPDIRAVQRDRQGDSGPGSPLGLQWDFGLDLVLNLSQGLPRRVIAAGPPGFDYSPRAHAPLDSLDLAVAPGRTDGLRGFALRDASAWQRVLDRAQPGRLYLLSFSKPTSRPGYRLLHYHVGLLLADERSRVWLYHATPNSGAHRLELTSQAGMVRFRRQFGGGDKRVLAVEVWPEQAAEASLRQDTAGRAVGEPRPPGRTPW
jgi:cell wall-associated NlpC family hydrolase